MARIAGAIEIARPPEAVFDVVADERNEPLYNPAMTSVEKLTEGPIGVGTRWSATVVTRGRPAPMELEVTDFSRPTRLATVTRMTTATVTGALTLAPVRGGTVMSWDWTLRTRGALRLLGPLFAVAGRRQEERIWNSLKRLLESEELG
ncbi:SRPBCC family protein [Sinomonas atrocyanea]